MTLKLKSRTVAMSDLTDRVSDVLSDLCQSVLRLQGLVGPLILEEAARNPAYLREVQDFDQVSQRLSNLADFLAALARACPDDWQLDPSMALRVVTLADLSAELRFAETQPMCGHIAGDGGMF